jgi:hypothetical protein
MSTESSSTSWWQTLPGVLTAIAGLITAVAGLLVVLLQTGVLHRRGDPPPRPGTDSVQLVPSPRGAQGPSTVTATRSAAPRSWQDADVILTGMDGTTTVLRAPSFRYCISVGQSLTLNGSQEIYFEQMRSVEVLRADPVGAPSGTAVVRITLMDGRALEGRVDAVCGLFGYNDLGRYDVAIQSLRRIEFRR